MVRAVRTNCLQEMRANIFRELKWELIGDIIPVRKLLGVGPDGVWVSVLLWLLISLAIKFCRCHQGLDTFLGDGILALRKSRLAICSQSREFFGLIDTYVHIHCIHIFLMTPSLFINETKCISEFFEAFNFRMYSPNNIILTSQKLFPPPPRRN